MPLTIKSFSYGTVTISPADTASNFTLTIPATTGQLTYTDATTGGMYLPTGTTAQRPASPATGMMRFNTTTSLVEVYNGTSWS